MKSTGKVWIVYDASTQRQSRPMSTVQAQVTLLNMNLKDPQKFFIWTPGWDEWKSLHEFLKTDQEYFVFAPAPGGKAGPQAPPPPASQPAKAVKAEIVEDDDLSAKTVTHVFDTKPIEEEYTSVEDPSARASAPKKRPASDNGYFMDDFSAEKIDPEAKHTLQFNLPGQKKVEDDPANRRTSVRHHFKIEVILVNKQGRSFRTFSENISSGGTLLENDLPKDFVNNRFDLILVNKFERDPSKGRLHIQGKIVGDYVNPRRLMFIDLDEHTQKRLDAMLKSYIEHQNQLSGKKKSS